MSDPILNCRREDFERFHDLCSARIDACPDGLWGGTLGGSPLWQQLPHTFACVGLPYAIQEPATSRAAGLSAPHERMSAAFGKPRTVSHALLGRVRHANHHLGCIDALSRNRGLAGVY